MGKLVQRIFKKNTPTLQGNYITWDNEVEVSNELELTADDYLLKIFSRSRTDLPKLIFVPTLLVSCYANWSYDSIGVDLSQLDEKGIAHYWCTSTKSMEEHGAEPGDEDPITTMVENAVLIEIDGCWFWDA